METFHLQDIESAVIDSERRRVLALLDSTVAHELIHEIGSTAVSGVIRKQDLDLLVLVPSAEFERTRSKLDERFRRDLVQMTKEDYQGYRVDSVLDVAIQLTVKGGRHDTFLDFLEQLRKSEQLRSEYNRLKRSFDGLPMDDYRDAKREFIERELASPTGRECS